MKLYTPLEYLYIDIANQFGLDKEDFSTRIQWTKHNLNILEELADTADTPILFVKAVCALRDVEAGNETGHIMSLDATSSNIQILSILSGDPIAASKCNVINTGHREDARSHLIHQMNTYLEDDQKLSKEDSDAVKGALMTVLFGSKDEPKIAFGDGTPRYNAFNDSLNVIFPGPMQAMSIILQCWQSDAYNHKIVSPNGHTSVMKTMVQDSKRFTLPELNNVSFTYATEINTPSSRATPLIANITHFIDGYIVQEMHTRCAAKNIPLITIHDCFGSSPVFMNDIRQMYIDIMVEIANMNLLQNILRQVTNNPELIIKPDQNLAPQIAESEYMLS